MSLRSVLVVVSLLAALTLAQTAGNATAGKWDDVLYSWMFNATPVKLCAVDVPTKCVNIIRLNATVNPNKTIVVTIYPILNVDVITEYSLLQAVASASALSSITIDVPVGGILYASNQFSVNSVTSVYMKLCNSQYYYAVPVTAGRYTVKNVNLPLYLMDNKTCISYKVIAPVSSVANITTPYALLAVFEMPSSRKRVGLGFNGTQHLYNLQTIETFFGRGFYLANGTQVPMIVVQKYPIYHGPVHFSAIGMTQLMAPGGGFTYTMGWTPGDGVAVFWVYQQFNVRAEVAFFGDGFGGYFLQENAYTYANIWRQFVIYAPRYSLVDITVFDGMYLWNTRTLACGGYRGETVVTTSFPRLPGGFLYRVDRVAEVEICNNSTYINYAGAYYIRYTGSVEGYFMIDRVEPGACRRFRWDGTPNYVYFFNSTSDVCQYRPTFWFAGSSFTPGWRYYVTQDRRLIRDTPIALDGMYLEMLNQTLQLLSSMYRNMSKNLMQWYNKTQANQSQVLSLSSFVASRQFVGTLRLDSATSTWLKTVYNELQKWRVVGSSASFGAVSLPAVPTAVAPAAAAAVAVAWAASRRDDDVATTAAVAGIALALFGILMTLVYGTNSLTLVALGVIVAAAAAAWRRIS